MDLHRGTSCAETERMNSKERDILQAKRGKRTRRWAATAAVFGVVSCWQVLASAQTVTFQPTTPIERSPDERAATEALRWIINREECDDEGAFFRFNLAITGWASGQNFEVWGTTLSSADCTQPDQQTGATARCVKLDTSLQWNGEMTRTEAVQFSIKELIGLSMEEGLADDCGISSDNPTLRDLVIYFMLTSGGAVVANSALKWPSASMASPKIDLWGPAPPTKVTVAPSEGSVSLTVEGAKETGSTEVVYCAKDGKILNGDEEEGGSSSCACNGAGNEGGGTGGSGGAGGGGASGSGGGATSSSSGSSGDASKCTEAPLVADTLPDLTWVPCAEGTKVEELENNVAYAMAVAYRDQVGNVGKLSPVVCATPEPVDDFYEVYRQNGGQGGGGYCSIAPRTLRNTTFGTSFALGALALVCRRRTRSSRNTSSKEVSK